MSNDCNVTQANFETALSEGHFVQDPSGQAPFFQVSSSLITFLINRSLLAGFRQAVNQNTIIQKN